MLRSFHPRQSLVIVWILFSVAVVDLPAQESPPKKTLNVLFIGNSYTARHDLPQVVKAMAEAGNPGLTMNPATVIYGGRTLADHWRFGTQNFVRVRSLTRDDEEATIAALEKLALDPVHRYASAALKRHRTLLSELESQRTDWDVVVLQSYRDELSDDKWLYAEYARKFSELAKAQGARVILYETTPTTQNAEPLKSAVDPTAVMRKARSLATLADEIGANAAPMSLVALRCQNERPDITLRFVNDAHLNQTMAYLTACTLYSAIFERNPQGLPIDTVTDIRFFEDKDGNKDRTKDRDRKPIRRLFSDKDRADLQRIAWQGFTDFNQLRPGIDQRHIDEKAVEAAFANGKVQQATEDCPACAMGLTAEFVFNRLDANKDKLVTVTEFRRSPGMDDEAKAGEAVGRLDKTGDGKLSWEELKTAYEARHANCTKPDPARLAPNAGQVRPDGRGDGSRFARVFILRSDKNGDGKIDKSEFRGGAGGFQRLDKNQNGFIEADELGELHQRRLNDPKSMKERLKDGDVKRPPQDKR